MSDKSAQLAQEHKNYNGFECTSHTDACGYKTNYTYDTSGRLIQKEREGILTAYAYDELGRQSATTIGKTTERLEYDLLDRVITNSILAKNELCFFEKYTYDKYGNKDSIERTIDDKKAIESFCYDAFSRLREHCDAAGYKTTITYNEKYDLGKWYVLQKTATDPNGTQTIETFDPHGRIKIRKKDTVLDEFSYSTHYDLLGLR